MATKSAKPVAPPAPPKPVKRPFPVTVLAILAGLAAVLAAFHALQGLGLIPYNLFGGVSVRQFNIWNFFMWLLMVWVWVWLFQMLWKMDPQGWMFLAVITAFNLILDFTAILASSSTFSDYSLSFIVNGLILLYCMLPGTRRAFGTLKE